MWGKIHADFLSADMANTIKLEYKNPEYILSCVKNRDTGVVIDVLGKMKSRYHNWDKFSIECILEDSAFGIAVYLLEL